MKKNNFLKKSLILLGVAGVVSSGVYFYPVLLDYQKTRIESLQTEISALKEELVPVRFKIIEKTDSSVTVEMRFYDADNKEISIKKLKLNGTELTFDFNVVKMKNNRKSDSYLFFPIKVFTDRIPPADGVEISGEYNKNEFPAIYDGSGLSENDRKVVTDLYKIILEKEPIIIEHFGSAVHDLKTISELKTGFIYRLVCHQSSGGMEIERD